MMQHPLEIETDFLTIQREALKQYVGMVLFRNGGRDRNEMMVRFFYPATRRKFADWFPESAELRIDVPPNDAKLLSCDRLSQAWKAVRDELARQP